jgi:hypothetical protein
VNAATLQNHVTYCPVFKGVLCVYSVVQLKVSEVFFGHKRPVADGHQWKIGGVSQNVDAAQNDVETGRRFDDVDIVEPRTNVLTFFTSII